eukprot:sb/3473143/
MGYHDNNGNRGVNEPCSTSCTRRIKIVAIVPIANRGKSDLEVDRPPKEFGCDVIQMGGSPLGAYPNGDPPIWITSHPNSFGGRSTSRSDFPRFAIGTIATILLSEGDKQHQNQKKLAYMRRLTIYIYLQQSNTTVFRTLHMFHRNPYGKESSGDK